MENIVKKISPMRLSTSRALALAHVRALPPRHERLSTLFKLLSSPYSYELSLYNLLISYNLKWIDLFAGLQHKFIH